MSSDMRLPAEAGELGQMVVELCVVMPVILMVAVAVIDGLFFAAVSSRFDHLAAQAVLAVAGAPQGSELSAGGLAQEIQGAVEGALDCDKATVSVSASNAGKACVFDFELRVKPWPLSSGGSRVMGMAVLDSLSHKFSFAVRPYVIGEIQCE